MARKNLLQGLMEPQTERLTEHQAQAGLETKSMPQRPRYAKGAIGAVGQTIADLKARAVVELDPHLITAGGLMDRLEHDEADHAALMASIRDYGQQVPVLVRPDPDQAGHYQIVYGRRRVLAARDLGISIKAMVRDLDDRDLLLAQGQENTARRDLSFIEKANFARQMAEADYKRKIICDALSIDKTVISRMFSVTDRVPVAVIEHIGSAPASGRGRWLMLAELIEETGTSANEGVALTVGETSDERLEALIHALTLPRRRAGAAAKAKRAGPLVIRTPGGEEIASLRRSERMLALKLPAESGFAGWLADNLDELHRVWSEETGGAGEKS